MKQRTLTLAIAMVLASAAFAPTFATAAEADETATQAKIDELQKQIDELKQALQTDKLTTQEQASVSLVYNRATITSADGRSSIAFRTLLQADAAHYDQDSEGPLSADYRRGSVGGTPNRENNAARDLSSGIYFRRARFGFEGTIARDFSYRLTLELGGAGTETQAASTTRGSPIRVLRRSLFKSVLSRHRPISTMALAPTTHCFWNAARQPNFRERSAVQMVASASAFAVTAHVG